MGATILSPEVVLAPTPTEAASKRATPPETWSFWVGLTIPIPKNVWLLSQKSWELLSTILPPVVTKGTEPEVKLEIVSWEVVELVVEALREKKFVLVALVVVEFEAVKAWRVVEPTCRVFVLVRNPMMPVFALRSVVEAKPEMLRFVLVAFVVVAVEAVNLWRVVEPKTRKLVV